MKLSAAVQDYCDCARHELGHSRSTYLNYRNRLRQFSQWVEAQGLADPPVGTITYELLRRYYFSVVGQGVRPRTVRSHLHALKCLFSYLTRLGVLTEDTTQKLKMPKLDAAERKLVSDDDLQKLLEAAARQASDFKAVRDVAVLSVLAFTAVRRAELLALTVDDIDLEEHVLLVRHGKGEKSRMVPLCEEVLEALEAWLRVRRRLPAKHDKLFTVDAGRPLGESGLAALVRGAVAIAGLKGEDRIKPHSIRHAAATRLLQNGANLKSIQTWLGHADIKTTAIYLHADEQAIRSIAGLAGFKKEAPAPPPREGETKSTYFQQRRRVSRSTR